MEIVTVSLEPGRERRKLVFECPRRAGHVCEVMLKPWPINSPTWTWDGNATTPTLTPSINCSDCGWHGFVTNGRCTNA